MAPPGRTLCLEVDGIAVAVEEGTSLLDACDAAGRYVPRLCHYPGLPRGVAGAAQGLPDGAEECGLCAVRVDEGSVVLACRTPAGPDARICTDDEDLRALRLARLETILAGHPHICLNCPDRDGCTREDCTYGNPPEARCCDQLGSCELARLVGWLDSTEQMAWRPVVVDRTAAVEGRIRLEMGLCIGCARCVRVCGTASDAGAALELHSGGAARPRSGTLRASGCTFCGLCVMVCPAGALTAPGDAGARWLAARREKSLLRPGQLPPDVRRAFTGAEVTAASYEAGVFTLLDAGGQVVLIRGVANLGAGLRAALEDPTCSTAAYFRTELHELYTMRESELLARYVRTCGRLPAANDLGDDLFDE